MFDETLQIVKMIKKYGFIRKTAIFAVFADGTYRQVNADGMSALTNDFADLFITMSAKGWKLVK